MPSAPASVPWNDPHRVLGEPGSATNEPTASGVSIDPDMPRESAYPVRVVPPPLRDSVPPAGSNVPERDTTTPDTTSDPLAATVPASEVDDEVPA